TTIWKDLEASDDPLIRRYHFQRNAQTTGEQVAQILHPEHKANPVKSLSLLVDESTRLVVEVAGPAGSFAGPMLEVAGTAVEQDLVRLDNCAGLWYRQNAKPPEMVIRGNMQAEVVEDQRDGRRVFRARFTDLTAAQCSVAPATKTVFVPTPTLRGQRAGRG